MLLFWQHGYEATSLADLTAVMGVTPPSVYAAFGNKKRLFLEVVDRYLATARKSAQIIDEAPTAREAALRLMRQAAVDFTGADTPPGCLLTTGAIGRSNSASDIGSHLANIRRGFEDKLADRISYDIAKGELSPATDVAALAAHTIAVIQGMSTLARDGADRRKLLRIAEMAINVWPAKAVTDRTDFGSKLFSP